jgi:hypothetical protein
MEDKIKFYEIANILDLDLDGDKTDLRLHGRKKLNWGAETAAAYEEATNAIDAISYKGNGWEVYATYDVSGFDYWMMQQEEPNYINMTIMFDNDTIDATEIPAIKNAMDMAYSDAYSIAEKYDYVPNVVNSSTVEGGEYENYVNNIYERQSEYGIVQPLYSFVKENGYSIYDMQDILEKEVPTEKDAWGDKKYSKKAIRKMIGVISGKYANGGGVEYNDKQKLTGKTYKINNTIAIEDEVNKYLHSLKLKDGYSNNMGTFTAKLTEQQLNQLISLIIKIDKNDNVYILDSVNKVVYDSENTSAGTAWRIGKYANGGGVGLHHLTGTAYYITEESAGSDYNYLSNSVLDIEEFNESLSDEKILTSYFDVNVKYDFQVRDAIYAEMAERDSDSENGYEMGRHIIGYKILTGNMGEFSNNLPYNDDEDDDNNDNDDNDDFSLIDNDNETIEVEIVQDKAYGKGYYVIRKYNTNNILHDSIEGLSEAYRVANNNGYEVIYAEGYDKDEYKRGGKVDGRSTRAKNTWNSGASWTRDRNAYNKSEDWEKPLNQRGKSAKSSSSASAKSSSSASKSSSASSSKGKSKNYSYIPNYMIRGAEVNNSGKTTDIDGANILDGIYVKAGTKYANGGGVGGDLRKKINPNINEAINNFERISVIQQGSNLDLILRKKYGNFPQDLYIDIDGDNSFTLKFDDRADAFIVYDLTKSKYAEGGGVGRSEWVVNFTSDSSDYKTKYVKASSESEAIDKGFRLISEDGEDSDEYSVESVYKTYAEGGGVPDLDKKMALINLDMIHEYSVKLDNIVTEETELEEWVKMKLTRIEQNVADVKHALAGGEKFDKGGMIFKKQLLHISKYAKDLIDMLQSGSNLMGWQENKLAIAADNIDGIYHYMDYLEHKKSSDDYLPFAKGGRVPRNVGRDWIFKSKQDWEQKYDRKREYKQYKKEGWFANWFKEGGEAKDFDFDEFRKRQAIISEAVKFAFVRAIGFDDAYNLLQNEDLSISPYRLVERAVSGEFIGVHEINKDVVESAIDEARRVTGRYKDSGQGIGSSDMTAFLKNFLDDAGFKTAFISSRLERIDENGNAIKVKSDLPNTTMFKDGGSVKFDEISEYVKKIRENRKAKGLGEMTQKEHSDLINELQEKFNKYAKGGRVKNYKYVPNHMIESVDVERNGKTTEIDGGNILDGLYVKGKVNFEEGGYVENIPTETLEAMIGRKLNGWNDDKVIFNGIVYKKCFMKPYYKIA